MELNPGYATAHHWYGMYLMQMARHDEAIKEIMLAKELDPISPRVTTNVGQVFFFARQYDRARETLEKAIIKFPDDLNGHLLLGYAYREISMLDEALAIFQSFNFKYEIALTYAKMGKRNEAIQLLDDLINKTKQDMVNTYMIACIYFVLGENDKGFIWLDKAYQKQENYMTFLKVDPYLDNVREDPRFKALLKKMNLE
ncbi:tetratricopeptide repeat protein [Acidobacteriota bacterium]